MNNENAPSANGQASYTSGMKTICIIGLASLSFFFALRLGGTSNHVTAEVSLIGSLLMWAVMTWRICVPGR